MFKKLKVAYKKVHSFLFGDENEHIHSREERKVYYGRIKKNEAEAEARMLHQYPQKGKFRFPIDVDNKYLKKSHHHKQNETKLYKTDKNSSVHKVNQQISDNHQSMNIRSDEKNRKLEERKKFQGVNFKARTIPSPVYAYQNPPTKTPNSKLRSDEENLTDNSGLNKESVYCQINFHEESVEQKQLLNLYEEVENVVEDKESDLIENEESVLTLEIGQQIAATVEEKIIPLRETNVTVNENNLQVSPVQTTTDDNHLSFETRKNSGYLQDSKLKQQNRHASEHSMEEAPRKTVVPFNVLMLQKDRIAQKKNHQTIKEEDYHFPTLQLLNIPTKKQDDYVPWLDEKRKVLEKTLENFNVNAKVIGVTKGPSVTRFEIQPEAGVKVSKITGLTDDIKLSLAAKDIRIEAPIPGRNAIGIEVPNEVCEPVVIREILRSCEFQKNPSPLTVALGLDISGKPIVTDIQKMPHGLIAGSTGSGKSVCINSILISIMFKATPDEVKLMLVDPKMVELAPYNDIPHLVTPVITDAKQATIALKWAVEEMERRYELFVQNGVRDIKRYNEVMKRDQDTSPAMPYIVIVIDELADLMMVSPQDVEEAICRIAQKARACGIHLLVATQRPSVDVITGLIKANIPSRIAFSVSSQADSRTIIDSGGAERLLGKGDMLFFENGASKPLRIQGNFVSDEEIDKVIELVKKQRGPNYLFDKENLVKTYESVDQEDDLFEEACYYVIEQGGASSSSLQRKFRIGFNRAARLIDMMAARGIISEAMGSKPRNVLVTEEELSERI